MKRVLAVLFVTMLVGQALASGGPKKMASLMSEVRYEIRPRVLEARNGIVEVEIEFTFPPKFFSAAAKVEITPVLKYVGKEKSFSSYTIQGERVQGNNPICSFANGGTFRTKSSIRFEEMMRSSELFVRAKIVTGNSEIVCSDVKIADGVIAPTGTYTMPEDYFAGTEWIFVNKHRATLPSKAKPKKIDYPNGYSVECYLLNNDLANKQPFIIIDKSSGKVIFEGCATSYHTFVGTWKKSECESACGTFTITNTNDKTFSLKTKGTTKLMFSVQEINSYITQCGNNSVLVDFSNLDNTGKGKLFVWGIDSKTSWFETAIDKATTEQLYKDVRNAFPKGIRGKVTDSDNSYTFNGLVVYNGNSGEFEAQEGKREYTKGKYREIEILNEANSLRINVSYANNNEISKASMVYNDIDFYKIKWWSIDDYIKNAKEIEITYPNKDAFRGSASYLNGKIKPEIGVYTYKNGDKFTGNVTKKAASGIFVDGTTTFWVDGKSVSGNWLSEYQLTIAQLDEISKIETPMSKRRYAEGKQKEGQLLKQFVSNVSNGDNAFREKKYDDAERWYTMALNSMPNDMRSQEENLRNKLNDVKEAKEKMMYETIRTESIIKGRDKYVVEYTRVGYRLIGYDDKGRKSFEYENTNKGTINLKTWNMKIPNRGKLVKYIYDYRGVLSSRNYYNESQSYYMKEMQLDDGSFRCMGIYENSGEFMDDILIEASLEIGFFNDYYIIYRNDPKTGMRSKITTRPESQVREWLLDYLYNLD